MLTNERIQTLSSKKGVKKIAVENFLMSVDANPDIRTALLNLQSDSVSYGWNAATVNAIRQGIVEFFK
jgi:hypothetical protein